MSLLVLSWVVILRILSEEDYADGQDPKSESAYVHVVSFLCGLPWNITLNFVLVRTEPRSRRRLLARKSFAMICSGLNHPSSDFCSASEPENDQFWYQH